MRKKFSERQLEVIDLLMAGYTTREIGEKLGISYRTAEGHKKTIMDMSGCGNWAQFGCLYCSMFDNCKDKVLRTVKS